MTDVAVYLLPGMKAKITVPGAYIGRGNRKIRLSDGSYGTYFLTNGFIVENDQVGSIESVESEPAIIYSHKKYEKNRIMFFGTNPGEMCTVSIISVPIHDHSSIVTGGPAFATYYTDDETITNND